MTKTTEKCPCQLDEDKVCATTGCPNLTRELRARFVRDAVYRNTRSEISESCSLHIVDFLFPGEAP